MVLGPDLDDGDSITFDGPFIPGFPSVSESLAIFLTVVRKAPDAPDGAFSTRSPTAAVRDIEKTARRMVECIEAGDFDGAVADALLAGLLLSMLTANPFASSIKRRRRILKRGPLWRYDGEDPARVHAEWGKLFDEAAASGLTGFVNCCRYVRRTTSFKSKNRTGDKVPFTLRHIQNVITRLTGRKPIRRKKRAPRLS